MSATAIVVLSKPMKSEVIANWHSEVKGHSNLLAFAQDGTVVHNKTKQGCYDFLKSAGTPVVWLAIAFENSKTPNELVWTDWFINRSFYKDVFITKDVKEGLENFFLIDTHQPYYKMFGGMCGLRNAFEYNVLYQWDFKYFLERGYSEEVAYVLSLNTVLEDGEIEPRYTGSNHFPVYYGQDYGIYHGKNYNAELDPNNMFEMPAWAITARGLQTEIMGGESLKQTWDRAKLADLLNLPNTEDNKQKVLAFIGAN